MGDSLLLIGPGLIALVALAVGVWLLCSGTDGHEKAPSMAQMLIGILLLLVALGIGGCYVYVFSGGLKL